MSEPRIRRLSTQFRPGDEKRSGEFDVTHVPVELLSRIVGPSKVDPLLYDSYKLNAMQVANLEKYTNQRLTIGGFDYYLETEAD